MNLWEAFDCMKDNVGVCMVMEGNVYKLHYMFGQHFLMSFDFKSKTWMSMQGFKEGTYTRVKDPLKCGVASEVKKNWTPLGRLCKKLESAMDFTTEVIQEA